MSAGDEGAASGAMDIETALQVVLKHSIKVNGLARGLRECAKALDKRQAAYCILAKNCDEQSYVKLVEALCAENGIKLLKVENNNKLGEWAGLFSMDKTGKARKVVRCSCVVIKDPGEQCEALDVLDAHIKSQS